jgi:hypothetical protein
MLHLPTSHQYYSGDHIENEMGGECSTYRRGAYVVLVGNLRERDHLEDVDLNGKVILRWIFKQSDGGHGLD